MVVRAMRISDSTSRAVISNQRKPSLNKGNKILKLKQKTKPKNDSISCSPGAAPLLLLDFLRWMRQVCLAWIVEFPCRIWGRRVESACCFGDLRRRCFSSVEKSRSLSAFGLCWLPVISLRCRRSLLWCAFSSVPFPENKGKSFHPPGFHF